MPSDGRPGDVAPLDTPLDEDQKPERDEKEWQGFLSELGKGKWDDKEKLPDFVTTNRSLVNTADIFGRTALHIAAERGLVDATTILLKDAKADISAKDIVEAQPLHIACLEGHVQVVKILIDWGADVEAKRASQVTPLTEACWGGRLEVVDYLLTNEKRGSNPNVTYEDGWTPLILASNRGHDKVVQKLLEKDTSNIDQTENINGWTALHAAIESGYLDVIPTLIKHGASIDITDKQGYTALHIASSGGNVDVVRMLLKGKLDVNATDKEGNTALHIASEPHNQKHSQSDVPYCQIIKLLLEHGANPELTNATKETALHAAARAKGLERFQVILQSGKIWQRDILTENDKKQTVLSLACDSMAAAAASTESGKSDGEESSEDKMWLQVIVMAARKVKTHDTAKWLIRLQQEGAQADNTRDSWSALEWAADALLPEAVFHLMNTKRDDRAVQKSLVRMLDSMEQLKKGCQNERFAAVLWLLLGESDRTTETTSKINAAILAVEAMKKTRQAPASAGRKAYLVKDANQTTQADKSREQSQNPSDNKESLPDQTPKHSQSGEGDPVVKDLLLIEDILRDLSHRDISEACQEYDLPEPKGSDEVRKALEAWEATVVQFFKGDNGEPSKTLSKYRPIQKVIYDDGPEKCMEEPVMDWRGIMNRCSDPRDGDRQLKDTNDPSGTSNSKKDPTFTWVHLPATNMDWMDHLLTRIMKDGGYDNKSYRAVKSFFRGTWVEIPDRVSPSRTLRPRTVIRPVPKSKDGNENQPTRGKSSKDGSKFVNASAIYMPYFCPSKYEQTDNNPTKGPDSPAKGLEDLERFKRAQSVYKSLVTAYKTTEESMDSTSVVHGSPTLDEWYYHFAKDTQSEEDRYRRNKEQVYTKFLKVNNDTRSPGLISLLRVNQLWLWTIDDKWIITATSCLFDDSHDTLVYGILQHLRRQDASGSNFHYPKSTMDMSRLIVDHCIESYERRPNPENHVSIRQAFSNYMNRIGRDESSLFEDFRRRTQDWHRRDGDGEDAENMDSSKSQRDQDEPTAVHAVQHQVNDAKHVVGSSSQDEQSSKAPSHKSAAGSPVGEIRNAVRKAERLYCEIKDVRDELNILNSVAQYQSIVQRGLSNATGQSHDEDADQSVDQSADYVVNDLKEMDIVANRIESAVNTTLSLQQSELANYQATVASDQGTVLMVFTFATLLFLPLSFLSSLFALDVSTFQKTPAWAFAVIFLVAVGTSVTLALGVIYWRRIRSFMKSMKNMFTKRNQEGGVSTQKEPRRPTDKGGKKSESTVRESNGNLTVKSTAWRHQPSPYRRTPPKKVGDLENGADT